MRRFNRKTKPLPADLANALRQEVHYNGDTGAITDAEGRDMVRYPNGQPPRIYFKGHALIARRVAILLRDGEWPLDYIEVRDGDPRNLKASNLEYRSVMFGRAPEGTGNKYDILFQLVDENMPHDHFKDEGIHSIRFDQRAQYVATVLYRLREAEHPHSNMADQYRLERTNFCLTAIGLKPATTLAAARARIDAII